MKQDNVRFWNLIEGQLVKITLTKDRPYLYHQRIRHDDNATIVITTNINRQGDYVVHSWDIKIVDGADSTWREYTRICHVLRLRCGGWVRKDRREIGFMCMVDQFEVDPFNENHFIHLPAWKDKS